MTCPSILRKGTTRVLKSYTILQQTNRFASDFSLISQENLLEPASKFWTNRRHLAQLRSRISPKAGPSSEPREKSSSNNTCSLHQAESSRTGQRRSMGRKLFLGQSRPPPATKFLCGELLTRSLVIFINFPLSYRSWQSQVGARPLDETTRRENRRSGW